MADGGDPGLAGRSPSGRSLSDFTWPHLAVTNRDRRTGTAVLRLLRRTRAPVRGGAEPTAHASIEIGFRSTSPAFGRIQQRVRDGTRAIRCCGLRPGLGPDPGPMAIRRWRRRVHRLGRPSVKPPLRPDGLRCLHRVAETRLTRSITVIVRMSRVLPDRADASPACRGWRRTRRTRIDTPTTDPHGYATAGGAETGMHTRAPMQRHGVTRPLLAVLLVACVGALVLVGAVVATARPTPTLGPQLACADVASSVGLRFTGDYGTVLPAPDGYGTLMQQNMGNGAAVGDYDGDGYLDVLLLGQAGHADQAVPQRSRRRAAAAASRTSPTRQAWAASPPTRAWRSSSTSRGAAGRTSSSRRTTCPVVPADRRRSCATTATARSRT